MAKAAAPPPGIAKGDHVYVQHKVRGPISVRVRSVGKDGFKGRCDLKQDHDIPNEAYLGHKSRMLHNYTMVEQGADGAILADDKGQRRFLAGEVPTKPAAAAEPAASADSTDDPLTGGLGRLHKADPMTDLIPPGARLLLKAQVANRPGLALQARHRQGRAPNPALGQNRAGRAGRGAARAWRRIPPKLARRAAPATTARPSGRWRGGGTSR